MVLVPADADDLIDGVVRSRLAQLEAWPEFADAPFFVADLGQVLRLHQRWKVAFPSIQPFYAVKCNADPVLLSCLANLGVGFDCASISEIESVLYTGVHPSRIIFANPCKAPSAIAYARQAGVMKTTFDNIDELDSIKEHNPNAELFLRIFAQDDTALVNFGEKFGAPLETTDELLRRAKELGLAVVGVSFHVGTGASDVKSFMTAIQHASQVLSNAERLGFNMRYLDIGGGFQDTTLEALAPTIQAAISRQIPKYIQVIAEPGRFYARSFYTMACKVISRRKQLGSTKGSEPDMLYQNDGIYGSFMNALIEKEIYCPDVIRHARGTGIGTGTRRDSGEHRYSIWGPTCDSVDCLTKDVTLDTEVLPGDWLKYKNMGAYTVSSSTTFNGFSNKYDVIYIDTGYLSMAWNSQIREGGLCTSKT